MKSTIFAYRFEGNIYINLTNRCCNSCVFCIRNNHDGIGDSGSLWLEREPTAGEVCDQVDLLVAQGAPGEFVFCGYGESTFRMDALLDVACHLARYSLPIRLNTNGLGSLINGRSIVPELAKALDRVSVSLVAPNSQAYLQQTRSQYGADAFDAMLTFARDCKQAGLDTELSTVDCCPGLEEASALAKKMGIPLRIRQKI